MRGLTAACRTFAADLAGCFLLACFTDRPARRDPALAVRVALIGPLSTGGSAITARFLPHCVVLTPSAAGQSSCPCVCCAAFSRPASENPTAFARSEERRVGNEWGG